MRIKSKSIIGISALVLLSACGTDSLKNQPAINSPTSESSTKETQTQSAPDTTTTPSSSGTDANQITTSPESLIVPAKKVSLCEASKNSRWPLREIIQNMKKRNSTIRRRLVELKEIENIKNGHGEAIDLISHDEWQGNPWFVFGKRPYSVRIWFTDNTKNEPMKAGVTLNPLDKTCENDIWLETNEVSLVEMPDSNGQRFFIILSNMEKMALLEIEDQSLVSIEFLRLDKISFPKPDPMKGAYQLMPDKSYETIESASLVSPALE